MQIYYLVAYAVIMCIITIFSFRKEKNMIYVLIMAAYAFTGVMSAICKIFQMSLLANNAFVALWYDISETTWWGYATLVICTVIALNPLRHFDDKNQLETFGNSQKMRNFFIIFSLIYITLALLFVLTAFREVMSVLRISNYGELRNSLYNNSENEETGSLAINFFAKVCLKLCSEFKLLAVFVSVGMLKEKIKNGLAVVLVGVSFFVFYIECSAQAARGGLLIYLICAALIALSFYKYMSGGTKRKVRMVAIVLGVVVLLFFVTVTTSRLVSDNNTREHAFLGNILFYLGHAPLEFSRITGSLTKLAYGRTIFGRLLSHYFGLDYSWSQIANDIGYPNIGALFVTYLGFLYTDFGSVGCVIFTYCFSFAMFRLIKKRPVHISTLYFFTYYLNFYVKGVFTVGRLEYASLITTIIIFTIIRIIERSPLLRKYFTARLVYGKRGRISNVWNGYKN